MVSKACVVIFLGVGLFLAIQPLLPRALAKRPGAGELMLRDRRTDLRRNYVVQGMDLDNELTEYGPRYGPPREDPLPAFVVDYANMIRNDIILLDNSVETRTRKRGNIKLQKHTNQAISDIPCSCARHATPEGFNLSKAWGADVFPQLVHKVTCDDSRCTPPFRCTKITYNVTVLKKTDSQSERERAGDLYIKMEEALKRKWVPAVVPVVTACLCSSSYLAPHDPSTMTPPQ